MKLFKREEKEHDWKEIKSIKMISRLSYMIRDYDKKEFFAGEIITVGTGINDIIYHIKRTKDESQIPTIYHVWLKKTKEAKE